MNDSTATIDAALLPLLQIMAREGIGRAGESFSRMVAEPLDISEPEVKLVPLADIAEMLGGPETEAVGIYLQAQGELPGQIMLALRYSKALELVDLMMGEPRGTTQRLGALERSALGELGNVTGTSFLNAVASLVGLSSLPSPPAVVVDMVGAILDIIASVTAGAGNHVLMFSATFLREGQNPEADFWVVPDPNMVEAFTRWGLVQGEY